MNYADKLRQEVKNTKAEIIATKFEPNRIEILGTIARGIERLGYVQIDTSGCHTGTYEGDCASSAAGSLKNSDLIVFADWLTKEGFDVCPMWWGYSSDGFPDMLKIRL